MLRESVRLALASLALLLVLAPAFAQGEDGALERNVAFILASVGLDAMPDGVATVHDAAGEREMPVADAIELAAERAQDADLGALVAGATNPGTPGAFAGDVWVYEVGASCWSPIILAPTPYGWFHLGPQMWVYPGAYGTASTGGSGVAIGWTTKDTFAYDRGITIAGGSDFYCVEWQGIAIHFPFLDGLAHALDAQSGE